MIRPIQFERQDTCPHCGRARSLEAFNMAGRGMGLTNAIDSNTQLSFYNIQYMKCKNCKSEFFPMWDGKYPTAMTDANLLEFMNFFKMSKIKAETTKQ